MVELTRMSNELMPVISLWKPWANWVALEWKTIETRTHKRFACLLGKRIGIHCSMRWDDAAIDAARAYLTEYQIVQTNNFLRTGNAIICTALVTGFRELYPLDNQQALIDCTHVTRYGLILSDIQRIELIPCKGKQGIWYVPVLNG